ncbi:hypothetical protein [Kribbella sp. NPDC000426]|uniref:hypothetical protein n=1 Tax=Kribbella sp. NPDC000426 TaxID=3154255 RepID=UPI0033197811
MNGTTIIWIVVAAAALVIVAALLAGAQSKTPKPRAEARPPSPDRSDHHQRPNPTQNLWPENDDPPPNPRQSKHTKH